MSEDKLYDALRAVMFACPPGCSCRGRYTGPERRAEHREPAVDYRYGGGRQAEIDIAADHRERVHG